MLRSPAAFFDHVRAADLLGPTLTGSEVLGLNAILTACAGWPLSYTAYALGTAYLETASSMLPIKERGGDAYFKRMYDIEGLRPAKAKELGNLKPGDGAKYAGRGYVQLTGKNNYKKADTKLRARKMLRTHESLIDAPDLAMRPDLAAAIMRFGMEEGWFTGRKMSTYLPTDRGGNQVEFKKARAIINGSDRDDDVASYAAHFRDGLTKGEWV